MPKVQKLEKLFNIFIKSDIEKRTKGKKRKKNLSR